MKEKVKFNWNDFVVYLGGPIDFSDDRGKGFRQDIRKQLSTLGFNPKNILDPLKKPVKNTPFDYNNEGEVMDEKRKAKDWDGLCNVVKQIMKMDLDFVNKSDFLIINIPIDKNGNRIHTYGTIHEIVHARSIGKPVFLIWEGGGKETCSGWLMALIGHENVFKSLDSLINHMSMMKEGFVEVEMNDWIFYDYSKL